MNLTYLFLAILGVFVIWKLFLFMSKCGNYHLIPKNIAMVYKTVKSKFKDDYHDKTELLFIAGIINAKAYIRNDENLIERIYSYAKSCSTLGDEVGMISDFSQSLMSEYFVTDSKIDPQEIVKSIWDRRHDIDMSVEKELSSKRYFPENVIKKDMSTIKTYYSRFGTSGKDSRGYIC